LQLLIASSHCSSLTVRAVSDSSAVSSMVARDLSSMQARAREHPELVSKTIFCSQELSENIWTPKENLDSYREPPDNYQETPIAVGSANAPDSYREAPDSYREAPDSYR
jgi:hypothetical protein